MRRSIAIALAWLLASLACETRTALRPSDGIPQYQLPGIIAVPGGLANAAGGNLVVERLDLSIDTILGTQEIRAVYNSASGTWRWNFQMRYDGAAFVDPTGARYPVEGLAFGEAIPGTVYVVVDGDTIETKGGLGYHFDGGARLDHVAWKTGNYPRIQLTWSALGVEMAQCTSATACAPFFAIALDAEGRPTSVTDARSGRASEFQYDGSGRLVVARDALDGERGWPGSRYEYEAGGTLLTAVTNSEGERIEYAYQGKRRLREVVQVGEGNPTHRFEFPAGENGIYPTIHTNPLGVRTRYAFDAQRRLREMELLDAGELVTRTWQANRPASLIGADGATTLFSYLGDDLAAMTQPSGDVISYTYAPGAVNYENALATPVARIEDDLGLLEERRYDALGRPVAISNGEGETVTLTYTAATLASVTSAWGARFEFPVYGIHGHWLTLAGDASDQRSFDPVGNALVRSVEGQLGGVLLRGYDANRNLVSVTLAATQEGAITSSGAIAIERRSDGRPTAVRRLQGADHEFEYDALGRLVVRRERVDGVWRNTTFEYDLAGRLTARTLPNGMREELEYDGYGRLTRRGALRDGRLEGEATIQWAAGRPVAVHDSIRSAHELYTYDAAGRLSTAIFAFGETLALEYDLRSRPSAERLSFPGAGEIRRIDYAYDLADRLVQMGTDGGELLVEWTYEDGQLTRAHYGNGLTREFVYDPVTGLAAATTRNGQGERVEVSSLERSAEVAPPRQQIRVQTSTALAATEEQYWLGLGGSLSDPQGFVGKRVFAWNDGGGGSRSFAYDEVSNRVASPDGDAFAYNAEANRLLAATLAVEGTTLQYSYDEAGFASARGDAAIEWTATGRMASHGADSIDWDMADRILSWTVAGEPRDFSLFGGRVEADPQTGSPAALDLGVVSLAFGSNARTWRHVDFRGNVSFVSDESGEIRAHYRYGAYALDAAFGASDDPVRFAARPALGPLLVLGARMYDPAVGRFLSPDPIFQLVNAYGYALGNPVGFWDPDGAQASRVQGRAEVRAVWSVLAASLILTGSVLGATAGGPIAVGAGMAALVSGSAVVTALAVDSAIDVLSSSDADLSSAGDLGPASEGAGGVAGPSEAQLDLGLGGAGALPALAPCASSALGRSREARWALLILVPLQLLLALRRLSRR